MVVGASLAALAVGPVDDLPAVAARVAIAPAHRHDDRQVPVVRLAVALPRDLLGGLDVDEVRIRHQAEEASPGSGLNVLHPVAGEGRQLEQVIGLRLRAGHLHSGRVPEHVVRQVLRAHRRQAQHEPEHLVDRPVIGIRVLRDRQHDRVRGRGVSQTCPRHGTGIFLLTKQQDIYGAGRLSAASAMASHGNSTQNGGSSRKAACPPVAHGSFGVPPWGACQVPAAGGCTGACCWGWPMPEPKAVGPAWPPPKPP